MERSGLSSPRAAPSFEAGTEGPYALPVAPSLTRRRISKAKRIPRLRHRNYRGFSVRQRPWNPMNRTLASKGGDYQWIGALSSHPLVALWSLTCKLRRLARLVVAAL